METQSQQPNDGFIKKIRPFLFLLLIAAISFFGTKFFMEYYDVEPQESTYSALEKVGLFLGIIVMAHIVILFHELGHVIGGLLGRQRFGFLVTGPLRVDGVNERLKFSVNKSASLWGGVAMMLPNSFDKENFKWNRGLLVAGGPVSSLITAIAFYGLSKILSNYELIADLLFVGAAISIAIFVATMIPSKTGGYMSDGMQLLYLWNDNPEARAYEAFMNLYGHLQEKRYSDMDVEVLQQTQAFPDGGALKVGSDYYHYYYYLEQRDLEKAYSFLEKVEQNIDAYPPPFRNEIWGDVCFFHAYFNKDKEMAASIFSKIQQPLSKKKERIYYLLEASMALLNNDSNAAVKWAKEGKEKSNRIKDFGTTELQEDLFNEIISAAVRK